MRELESRLRPIVEEEERRAGAHVVKAGREIQALDRVGLKALNDLLRTAFDSAGTVAAEPGGRAALTPPPADRPTPPSPAHPDPDPQERATGEQQAALRFKRSPIRLHPGEQRRVTLLADPTVVPPGTEISFLTDPGIRVTSPRGGTPEPRSHGWSSISLQIRARVSVDPGSRLFVIAEAAGQTAELEVLIVRHRASGWVREIARKDIDSVVEAEFDPDEGVVTVYEGRREFRTLERAARRAGLSKRRVREYLPYRMLEVEAAANAVYAWAAERVVERRAADGRLSDPSEYAEAIRLEAQTLRHRAHEKLMRAFLEPEVFEGAVRVKHRD
jgi:hypothetical protein